MDQRPSDAVPVQETGAYTNTEFSFTAESAEEAAEKYDEVRSRLMQINQWQQYAGTGSAEFRLFDELGAEISRMPQPGDFIRINIPGPGPVAGDGYDWVKIETIEDVSDNNDQKETVTIRVRPAPSPLNDDEDIAHFFAGDASSSFVVQRNAMEISAGVFGRNELPNTAAGSIKDKARNALTGVLAILGFSKFQWKNLAKGLVEGK